VGDGVWSSLIVAGVAVVGLIGMLWARRLLQRRAARAEAGDDA
jgi:hypothetical protein